VVECMGAVASIVVDSHVVGGGDGLEGGTQSLKALSGIDSTLGTIILFQQRGQLSNTQSPSDVRD